MRSRLHQTRNAIGDRDAGGGSRGEQEAFDRVESGAGGPSSSKPNEERTWKAVSVMGGLRPPPRSGAASVVREQKMYLYGGYGGQARMDDLWSFDFVSKAWTQIECEGSEGPGPMENNGVVVVDDALFFFGGYNGYTWLSHLHEFNLTKKKWRLIEPKGTPPSARFGYVSAAFSDSNRKELIYFAGFDGSCWLNDMYVFSFVTNEWRAVRQHGDIPAIRSCPSWARHEDTVYVFGGFDGISRLNSFSALDLKTLSWRTVKQRGIPPLARYFHSSVVFKNQLYVYAGYSGSSRLGDLHCFDLETNTWSEVQAGGDIPAGRSSLVAQVYGNSLFCAFGYNGREVLNDSYSLTLEETTSVPPPTLLDDLKKLVNNQELSDVTFLVDGQQISAVSSLLAIRSQHFRALLFGGMRESKCMDEPIAIENIEAKTFLKLLGYLYTDMLSAEGDGFDVDDAVSLLIAAERFLIDRLKSLCVEFIRNRIVCENVVHILLMSHRHNASQLKDICVDFIVTRFEAVKQTPDFLDLQREPELLMTLLLRVR